MNIQERFLWIAAVILVAFYAQNTSDHNNRLQTLLQTYEAEGLIQGAQISDFALQLNTAKDAEYSRGFENGRTQAAVAFLHENTVYNYTDGYHAAIGQFGIADHNGNGLSQDFLLELLLDTLDTNNSAEETYLEILDDLLSEDAGIQAD